MTPLIRVLLHPPFKCLFSDSTGAAERTDLAFPAPFMLPSHHFPDKKKSPALVDPVLHSSFPPSGAAAVEGSSAWDNTQRADACVAVTLPPSDEHRSVEVAV